MILFTLCFPCFPSSDAADYRSAQPVIVSFMGWVF